MFDVRFEIPQKKNIYNFYKFIQPIKRKCLMRMMIMNKFK